jgi:serine protease AprX
MNLLRKRGPLAVSLLALPLVALSAVTPMADASTLGQVVLDPAQKVHPMLQVLAQQDPTTLVRVIVQKTRPDIKSSPLLANIPGAQFAEDFSVVPAFVATLPESAVPLLAADKNVRYISPDGSVQMISGSAAKPSKQAAAPKPPKPAGHSRTELDPSQLLTTFPIGTGASSAWSGLGSQPETGSGIGVAVIDSGVDVSHPDLNGNVVAVNVNRNSATPSDGYGHGTHVAGIIDGHASNDQYLGVAPNATVISVKVADDNGGAYVSDLLRGLDWVAAHKDAYHIRALNLSASVSFPESYTTSPVDAAVEHRWGEGVVVVTSAGNLGAASDAVWYAPGNDPQVITVGCLDDNQTTAPTDDSLCPISSRGTTEDGFTKPDLIAPGRKIVSTLGSGINGQAVSLATEFPDRISADGRHISLSGTSMATPMVTGAVALLLDRHPNLTPSQVKQLLVSTARSYAGQPDAAGALNITAALAGSDHPPAVSKQSVLSAGATTPSATSTTIVWDGARWTSTYWDGARWTSAYWDGARWTTTSWDGARWTGAYWDGARWTSTYWDGARWTGSYWDGARWTGAYWDGARWTSSSNFN